MTSFIYSFFRLNEYIAARPARSQEQDSYCTGTLAVDVEWRAQGHSTLHSPRASAKKPLIRLLHLLLAYRKSIIRFASLTLVAPPSVWISVLCVMFFASKVRSVSCLRGSFNLSVDESPPNFGVRQNRQSSCLRNPKSSAKVTHQANGINLLVCWHQKDLKSRFHLQTPLLMSNSL